MTITFLTFDHTNSSSPACTILLWWSAIAAVHSICCTLEIFVGFWPHFLRSLCRRHVCEGQKTNSCIVVHVCVCVWIISRSISIPLALDVDRCLQEAASEPHGILDHVGQIYGLMLPLTTRRPTLVTLVRPTGAICHAMLKASTLLAHLHSRAIDCI